MQPRKISVFKKYVSLSRRWLPWKREFDIQEAIDDLPVGSGPQGLVWVKEGTYIPGDAITIADGNAVILEGAGIGTKIQNNLTDKFIIQLTESEQFACVDNHIRNLQILCNGTNHGIKLKNTYRTLIENVKINQPKTGIELETVNWGAGPNGWAEAHCLRNIWINDPRRYGIKFTKTAGTGSCALASLDHIFMNLRTSGTDVNPVTGIEVTNLTHADRQFWNHIQMWIDHGVDNLIGAKLDSGMDRTTISNFYIENQWQTTTPTNLIGLLLTANFDGEVTWVNMPVFYAYGDQYWTYKIRNLSTKKQLFHTSALMGDYFTVLRVNPETMAVETISDFGINATPIMRILGPNHYAKLNVLQNDGTELLRVGTDTNKYFDLLNAENLRMFSDLTTIKFKIEGATGKTYVYGIPEWTV